MASRKPRWPSLVGMLALCLCAGLIKTTACAVDDSTISSAGNCQVGPTCLGTGEGGGSSSSVQFDANVPTGSTPVVVIESLCGSGACDPDAARSCQDYGEDPTIADAGFDAVAPLRDAGRENAKDGSSCLRAMCDAALGDADSADAVSPSDSPAMGSFGCQVTLDKGKVGRECRPAGSGSAGAPCFGSSDCQAGFACVGEINMGQCFPYCCEGQDSCMHGTICLPRPLQGEGTSALIVPVCTPPDECSLDEPFPCQESEAFDCVCGPNAACTVVGDGTTSCLPPGSGEAGDSCPCAHNYICSQGTGTCLALCNLRASVDPCGVGRCQVASFFPNGWGVCVGALPSAPEN